MHDFYSHNVSNNNCSMVCGFKDIADGDLTNIINTNVTSVMCSCRQAVLSMKRHSIKDGHIININR